MTTPSTAPHEARTDALAGKTALVTGAAGGIGQACARALAADGAKVHLVDLAPEVATLADELGGQAHEFDITDAASVAMLPDDVDVLVNNAGLQHLAPIHEFPVQRYELLQRVMVTAPFRLIQHCLPHMYAKGWGRLVHVSSVHGWRASPYKAAYVAAKHGLEGLSKVAALEGAEHGVTSNCVAPGYVRTPLVREQVAAQALAHGITEDEVLDQVFLRNTAVKRLIEPDEVAALVRWLCGDDASYLTGTSLPLDGGWTAS